MLAVIVALVVAAMSVVGCSSDDSQSAGRQSNGQGVARTVPTDDQGRTESAEGISITVQPDNRGQSLLDGIAQATTSVDVVVYEIDAPQINAALVAAIERGVNVRMVLNGQWFGGASTRYAYDLQTVLQAAAAKPGAGTVQLNWSSNNFQITHQKTVLIDALAKDGTPLGAGDLPPTAQAHVLTGNLNAYNYQSYQPNKCGSPCNFWSARDFYMLVTDTTLVAEIARVFASDFSCAPATETNGLLDTPLPLTWSNGSTGVAPGDPAGQYPAQGIYPYPFVNTPAQPLPDGPDPGPGTDQGNVRARTLKIINAATTSLDVYNEEMADQQTVDALAAAAARLGGGKVRVVMTGDLTENSYAAAYDQLVAAGVVVKLFPNLDSVLYIHAKAVVADGTDAYIGSTNISSPSMNFNRELGLVFDDQPEILAPVITTFEADFSNPVAKVWPTPSPSTTTTAASVTSVGPSVAQDGPGADLTVVSPDAASDAPMACGPIVVPTPWPPPTSTTTTTTTRP